MRRSKKKATAIVLITLLAIIIAGFVFSPFILPLIIKNRILATFENLKNEKGIIIKYDTLYSIPGKIAAKNIIVTIPSVNSSCTKNQSKVSIVSVEISGIHILPLIFSHALEIDSLLIDQSSIDYIESNGKTDKDKKSKTERIGIGYLSLNGTTCRFIDSASCKPTKTYDIEKLSLIKLDVTDLDLDSAKLSVNATTITLAKFHFIDELYTISLKQALYAKDKKILNIDSLQIVPDKDKVTFAIQKVNQIDRIHCILSSIKFSGFEIISLEKPLLYAGCLKVSTRLDVFRDKRYPFRNKPKALPVKLMKRLPFFLQIDTVKLTDSYIAYEEFPEEGDKAGNVFFNNVNGTIYNLSNNSSNDTKMEVTARFMDAGVLRGNFLLPANEQKPYTAKGSLTNFQLPKINSMLTPAASAEISEGTLNALKFNFVYNETRSDGEVTIDYADLKLNALNKDKEKSDKKFISFLLNLIVRDDMNARNKAGKNTGTILFYRDPQKSIFNYWWKSILSGIKSVYNLDKIMDTDGKD